ncbi:MAG: S8 family peptidase [Pseudomonadota bacterium]
MTSQQTWRRYAGVAALGASLVLLNSCTATESPSTVDSESSEAVELKEPSTQDEMLLAMLQGPDLTAISAAIEKHGGQVTHTLALISGIGASLTRSQLERVVTDVPSISRVIDDLAWEPEPELVIDERCTLRSAIQLRWRGATANWVLYNKGDAPIVVGELEFSGYEALGRLIEVRIDQNENRLEPDATPSTASWSATTSLPIAPHEQLRLSLTFETPPVDQPSAQNKLDFTAALSDDCKSELVPSYPEPAADSYFAAASGVNVLHRQGITGKGINVAILDSGLWEESKELKQDTNGQPRVIARYDAIQGKEVGEAIDDSGHGTHMTSVLARSSAVTRKSQQGSSPEPEPEPNPSYRGIAPDVGIVAVKAIGETGQAGFLDLIRGIQWVVANQERFNIRVLNLSFASRPRWPYWQDPVNQALMQAWKAGIFITAAAGNEGPEPMTVGSPGNLPYLLTVGAITDSWTENDRNDDYIPDFSSRGPTPMGHIKPEIVAYGGHIAGIVPPTSALAKQFPEYLLDTGEFVMTGTSQASALVAGLAALVLQVEPDVTNDELKCMFTTSAEPAIEIDGRYAYSPFTQGEGLINIQRAITIGFKECGNGVLDLEAELESDQHFYGPAVLSKDAPPALSQQNLYIHERISEKGLSATRRWGVNEHLQRLEEKPSETPIDWYQIYLQEAARMKSQTLQEPPTSPRN